MSATLLNFRTPSAFLWKDRRSFNFGFPFQSARADSRNAGRVRGNVDRRPGRDAGQFSLRPSLTLLILGGFATLALVLACVGLFGVVAHGISARTREIGVRLALGAKPREVVGFFMRQAIITTAVGLAIGASAGLAMARLVEAQGLLFHVTARDPIAFVSAIVSLFCVSLAACYVPARRASRVDPAVTLRGA